jgi:hypothetical protein
MRTLRLSVLAVCAATLVVMAACSDTTEPRAAIAPDLEALAQTTEGGEICWYLDSTHPDYTRHVVTKGTIDAARFGEPLPPGFFPDSAWLVTGGVRLYEDGGYTVRVGNGYMVSALQKNKNKYDVRHQVVLQPYIGDAWPYNPGALCAETKDVYVCTAYDNDGDDPGIGDGACIAWTTRTACVGTFLAQSSETCGAFPCTTRSSLKFISGSWTGFINTLSGNINNANGLLDTYQGDPVIYGWPHGRLCVQYGSGGGGDPPGNGKKPARPTR